MENNKGRKQQGSQITYPTCNDNPSNNRNKGQVSEPSLPLECHDVRKNRSEERRGSTNSLVERHRQIPKRDVPKHHRDTENETKRRDLEELNPGSNGLHRHNLHPRDGNIAEQRARSHVTHGEKDRVLETIVAEQVLVQQKHSNVGRVPRCNKPNREETARTLHSR